MRNGLIERPTTLERARELLLASACVAVCLAGPTATFAAERFPPPDFSPGYQMKETRVPAPASPLGEYADLAVLVAALSASSYLALRARSRRGLLLLTIFSVAYFGFWRKGCVCPIGAIQNVALALFQPGYAIPVTIAAFFILPLAFTLFFGRTFCGAVCPLGAVQDLVLVRAVNVPRWLEHGLRLGAYAYLGLAVLFAATASAFVICEYDPFVAFFRLSGSSGMLLLGAGFIALGMVIGRPYCRFLCPYGVLLGMASRLSRWRVTITPDSCVRCRLCEDECPFGAIEVPRASKRAAPKLNMVAGLFALVPVLAGLGGLLGAQASGALAQMNATVRLSERIFLEDSKRVEGTTESSAAYRGTGKAPLELHAEALSVRSRFRLGSSVLGAFLGLVVGIKLLQAVLPRRGDDYEVHRSACLACGRCFFYCPQEHERLKKAGVALSPSDVSRQL